MDRERLKGNLDLLLLSVLGWAAQGRRPPAAGAARAEPGWSA